jgi:hypothetical protein
MDAFSHNPGRKHTVLIEKSGSPLPEFIARAHLRTSLQICGFAKRKFEVHHNRFT